MSKDKLAVVAPLISKIPANGIVKETFPVLGMSCAACAISVESMIKSVEGVKDAGVNYANQSLWVERQPWVTPAFLQQTVQSIGYDLVIDKQNENKIKEEDSRKQYQSIKQKTIWSLLLSVPVVAIGMFFMSMPYANWIMMAFATPVVFYFGRGFFINAWKQARFGKANMDTLVALSTGIAYMFSFFNTAYPQFWHQRGLHAHVYFEAAAVVIAFISLGKLLEERAKSNTTSALKKLIGLQPQTATIVKAGNIMAEIQISNVRVNDMLLIKPGEKVPVDGIVAIGQSYVDESMISGEPAPVPKERNDKVFAGTINQKGSFQLRAEKIGADTILANIIRMVQEAQGSKAPVQKLVDKIAGVFVPVVLALSIVTFIVWMLAGGDNAFVHALLTAVTVLVIACPCALGLATPTAIMVGVGKGAENNILIRDAESLELAHQVNVVILDKTGTITEGKPEVSDMVFFQQDGAGKLKSLLLSIELQSEHPLAEAVVKKLQQENISPAVLENVESITGKGVAAWHDGRQYFVGNEKLMIEKGVVMDNELRQKMEALQAEAKTVVVFAEEKKVAALIAIADKIKPTSRQAIESLHQLGIRVYMVTGDNQHTANAVALQAGLKDFRAEVLPGEKADFVRSLQLDGKIVAMVGDGINDSQALAQADVSIAMGKGSDIAMDVAKMTLITSDLNSIPKALKLSRRTVRTIRQNLFWAFIYNLAGIPIAAGILYPFNGFLLDPMIAGAAMAMSSVSVVTNSLRLKMMKL